MSETPKVFRALVFVEKLNRSYNMRHHDEIVAIGEAGMFLCRDSMGCIWFETLANLHKHYGFVTGSCGLIFTIKGKVARPEPPFFIEKDGITIIVGEDEDSVVSYPSGISYVIRERSGQADTFLPINLDGSKQVPFNIIP